MISKACLLWNNKLIYNILINGYPYKTPAQLGVESKDDAYVATKLALKNALLDRDVTGFYKAADARGEKTLSAMFSIIEKGKNGNVTNKEAKIAINKVGSFKESGEYYYQEYNVTADVNISEFTVDEGNEYYCAEDGVLFNKDKTILVAYPPYKARRQFFMI